MENTRVHPSDYVVLDVETNGLSSLRDDLLSITVYQPDTNKLYNRFLPLELDGNVYTTHINGITKEFLKNLQPLTQKDVDDLIAEYDLRNRTILTYGNIDEKFIKNYFRRKGLIGFEKLNFFNFKRNIISSRFSGGNVTKDNLCRLYGIGQIGDVHTGINDCLLEWELFKRMNGNKLLITHNDVFEFNNEYIIPASYLANYPNFKYHTQNLPQFKCRSKQIKEFDIVNGKIKRFPTNFNGKIIEHLINSMLKVEKIDSSSFLSENKKKLKYIGRLPSPYEDVYMHLNVDGTVTAVKQKDKNLEDEINHFILLLKNEMVPLIDYLRESIFKKQHIFSQELVVHRDKNVLAVCDLSSDAAVLEIKAFSVTDLSKIGNQLFYESNGRACYIMQTDWSLKKRKISFIIQEVTFEIDNSLPVNALESRINNFKNRITNKQVDVIKYVDSYSKVTLRCKICGKEFTKSYNALLKRSECPYCITLFRK